AGAALVLGPALGQARRRLVLAAQRPVAAAAGGIPRLGATAGARHRHVRLLQRQGPEIHVAYLPVAALPGERAVVRPGLHDEIERFLQALLGLGERHAV